MSTSPGTIQVDRLTKRFGALTAVDDLSFTVHPGRVTGFLGPNGSGKTTTLRMMVGLTRPTSGSALIGGREYASYPRPASVVGAGLEANSFHPGRTARGHLRAYAPQVGASDARVDEVLELVGLTDAAKRRVGGFSLGMRQRLGLATTLLGDPQVLLLDEPANGLDPQGISWLRLLLRHLASEGRTVLVSSHVLTEVQQTVDDVIIISAGRLAHASTLAELAAMGRTSCSVLTPNESLLRAVAARHGWQVSLNGQVFTVEGATAAQIGAVAFTEQLELHGLYDNQLDLESTFLELTRQAA
jgi:ABC-2 type transport system ATP-binding protein